jgi:hypothetical protein
MMTGSDRPGVEVPEPDWNEQLVDAATHIDDDGYEEPELGVGIIREADAGDVADQSIVVEVDDEDGYESTPI